MENKIDKASGTSYASYNPSASNTNGYASSTGNIQNTFVANSKQTQTTPYYFNWTNDSRINNLQHQLRLLD